MPHESKIQLWRPIAALAFALFAVGWIRTPRSQPAVLVPGHSPAANLPSPTSDPIASALTPREDHVAATTKANLPSPAQVGESPSRVVLLHGRLCDAAGVALPDPRLSLTDANGSTASVNVSDGRYVTGGLTPGRWIANLTGPGIAPRQETLDLAAEPALVEHDFVTEVRRRVPVALRTPEGVELYSAMKDSKLAAGVLRHLSILATREESPPPWKPSGLDRLRGNSCGVFDAGNPSARTPLPEGCSGTFEFRVAPPLWMHVVLGHERVASRRIDEIPEQLELVVDPARILNVCGNVLLRPVDSQSGAPIPDAWAMYGTLQSGSSMTKEDERLVLHGISPGAYYVRLGAKDRCMVTREIVVGAGETLDLGDVPMPLARAFRLHFADREGKPLAVEFNLDRLVPGDPRATMGLVNNLRYVSKADGVADLPSVAPGSWVVRIGRQAIGNGPGSSEPSLCMRPQVLDTSDPGISEATIVLEPACEIVLLPRSADARGLRFYLDTLDGLPVRAGGPERRSPVPHWARPG